MRIQRAAEIRTFGGDPRTFSGKVTIAGYFAAGPPGRVTGATVTFAPGARTHWHTHPYGQVLLVSEGTGWTQCEGGPVVEIRAGDVVWCPANERHWHGATPTSPMTHIAIAEADDEGYATWMEAVTDAQYVAPDGSVES